MQKFIKSFISGLSEKEKKILNIAVVIVFIALFDRIILGPISGESEQIEEKIERQTKLIEKNLLILRYKERIVGEDESYSSFYTEKNMVQEELIAAFLSQIEGLAKASGVALVNINPVSVTERTDYIEYSLTIESSSTMEQLLTFIYKIDNSDKPLRTVSLDLAPKNRDNYEVRCILTILKMIIVPDDSGGTVTASLPERDRAEETLPEAAQVSQEEPNE